MKIIIDSVLIISINNNHLSMKLLIRNNNIQWRTIVPRIRRIESPLLEKKQKTKKIKIKSEIDSVKWNQWKEFADIIANDLGSTLTSLSLRSFIIRSGETKKKKKSKTNKFEFFFYPTINHVNHVETKNRMKVFTRWIIEGRGLDRKIGISVHMYDISF